MSASTNGTVFLGVYSGTSIQNAFANPQGLDIAQVVTRTRQVLWNVDKNGVATSNPANPSTVAGVAQCLLNQGKAATLAIFIQNHNLSGYNLDWLQIISPTGGGVVYHINYLGTASTP
jgi:hypothetical protein